MSFPDQLHPFGSQFKPLKNLAYRKNTDDFYVYAKDRDPDEEGQRERDHSKDVQGCVSYMMRYASRPAMAESRIISYNKETDEVVWFYDDHKTGKRITVHETGLDLLLASDRKGHSESGEKGQFRSERKDQNSRKQIELGV